MATNLFKISLNVSDSSQGFYMENGEHVVVPPHTALDTAHMSGSYPSILHSLESFIEELKRREVKRFYIKRTFALGDVLMLVPVIRFLRHEGFRPYLYTQESFILPLRKLGIPTFNIKNSYQATDYGIILDGTVEWDHVCSSFQKYHRVELYFETLGVKRFPKDLDWHSNLAVFPEVPEIPFDKYIVFQGQGSHRAKSLPRATIEALINQITKDGVPVVYIGDSIGLNLEREELVHLAFFKYSILQLFSLIAKARCLITMDSAPLWIAHFTKTPTIGIFGPTDSRIRLKYHPLYPDGVHALQLNKRLGCKCCFEAAKDCNWKFQCLQVPAKELYSDFSGFLAKMMEAG